MVPTFPDWQNSLTFPVFSPTFQYSQLFTTSHYSRFPVQVGTPVSLHNTAWHDILPHDFHDMTFHDMTFYDLLVHSATLIRHSISLPKTVHYLSRYDIPLLDMMVKRIILLLGRLLWTRDKHCFSNTNHLWLLVFLPFVSCKSSNSCSDTMLDGFVLWATSHTWS